MDDWESTPPIYKTGGTPFLGWPFNTPKRVRALLFSLRSAFVLSLMASLYVWNYGTRDFAFAIFLAGVLLIGLSESAIRKALISCYPVEVYPSGVRLFDLRAFRFRGAMRFIHRSSMQRIIVLRSPQPGNNSILSLTLQTKDAKLSVGSRGASELAALHEQFVNVWGLPVRYTFPYFMGA